MLIASHLSYLFLCAALRLCVLYMFMSAYNASVGLISVTLIGRGHARLYYTYVP